jgi:multiple sugar transport system ATP-binding protein
MATVSLSGLSKYFDSGRPAVKDVHLNVAHGEFMVLLGPSGCGKSTTLRMIAGLETISEGTLEIDGRRVNDVPAKDRDIAMVFQSYALYPHMSVEDNLAFGLKRRNVDKAEIKRRVQSAAGTLGLTELLARKPYALSGGQRQRVALGRAIVRDPKVFLFDEPLSNLDAGLRVSMRSELVKLHQRLGATMIYVTHDQVEAMTMGTRICIMNQGKVVQVGKPLDVYRNPANIFVARFLGAPPTNLIPAVVERELKIGDCRLTLAAPMPDGELIFGIRPEDVRLDPQGPLETEVSSVEPLGAETILTLQLAATGSEIMVRADRNVTARIGERLRISMDLRAAHFFDKSTGNTLTNRSP